jgi:hypothetical protein
LNGPKRNEAKGFTENAHTPLVVQRRKKGDCAGDISTWHRVRIPPLALLANPRNCSFLDYGLGEKETARMRKCGKLAR